MFNSSMLLNRKEIIKELERGYPLSLVNAPAGYGKTTTIRMWARSQTSPTIWLSVDENGDSLVYFWKALFNRIAAVLPEASKLLSFCSLPGDVFPGVIPQALSVLAKSYTGKLNIIIDDIQNLSDQDLINSLAYWTSIASPLVKFVISGRESKNFETLQSNCFKETLKIGKEDLKLNYDEVHSLLNQGEHRWEVNSTRKLCDAAKGWPLFINLVRTFRAEEKSPVGKISDTGCIDDLSLIPIFEKILDLLDPGEVDVLETLSTLPKFKLELLRQEFSEEQFKSFEQLFKMDLFFSEDEEGWLRIHDQFRTSLYARYSKRQKTENLVFFKNSSLWYLGQGQYEHALALATLAKDWLCVKQANLALFEQKFLEGRHVEAYKDLSDIPKDITYQDPELLNALAWSVPDELKLQVGLDLVGRGLKIVGGNQNRVRSLLLALQGHLKFILGDYLGSIRSVNSALKFEGILLTPVYVRLLNTLGQCYFHLGRLPKAEEFLKRARFSAMEQNRIHDLAVCSGYLMQVLHLQGKIREAREVYQSTVTACESSWMVNNPMFYWIKASILPILIEAGNLIEAEGIIRGLQERCEQVPINFTYLGMYLAKVVYAINVRDWDAAIENLALLKKTASILDSKIGFGYPSLEGMKAFILYLSDRHLEAYDWVDNLDFSALKNIPSDAGDKLIAARFESLRNPEKALKILEDVKSFALTCRNRQNEMLVYIIESRAFHQQGNTVQSSNVFEQAVKIAMEHGFISSLLSEGVFVFNQLIEYYQTRSKHLAGNSHFSKMMKFGYDTFGQMTRLSIQLTATEKKVLKLVSEGFRDKEISERLKVSVGTTKTHIRNILRKLEVKNRSQAVFEANRQGLLC